MKDKCKTCLHKKECLYLMNWENVRHPKCKRNPMEDKMREIKFRMFDHANKEYRTVGMCIDSTGEVGTACGNCVIEQSTGLKDNQGKEIYEGDIITLNYGIPPTSDTLQIVWYSDYYLDLENEKNISYCGWFFKNIRHNGCSAPAGMEYQGDIEIIGNIHQNPELLKEKP